ncbi:hypothetical protein BaRGS_00013286 [Batillaria attramentaria]|uniref:Uncharacterized protein n=1 Tax=Batillaria attramentaria TaxID=370345 RepID=A0ABD0L8I3_9CAEN
MATAFDVASSVHDLPARRPGRCLLFLQGHSVVRWPHGGKGGFGGLRGVDIRNLDNKAFICFRPSALLPLTVAPPEGRVRKKKAS